MVRNKRRQRGEGRLGLIIAVAVVGIGIFVGVKYIPVKIAAYEFKDALIQECRMGAVRRDDGAVARRIMEKAEELEIPLKTKNLEIRRTRGEMIITAKYEQPIDLKLTTYVYQFHHQERAPLF